MRKTGHNPQTIENKPNLVHIFPLTENIQKDNVVSAMAKTKPRPRTLTKVAFIPNAEENAIIQAGQRKHGIIKATDIVRMALRRFAEVENLELKAS